MSNKSEFRKQYDAYLENRQEHMDQQKKLGLINDNYPPIEDTIFYNLLDEARKEFPCFPICKKYGSNMTSHQAKSGIRCDLGEPNGCFAWEKWFLKWFGDLEFVL